MKDARLFEECLSFVLRWEGGFVDHPADPGGATNRGISLRFLRALGDEDADGTKDGDLNADGAVDRKDVELVDEKTAGKFYRRHFWEACSAGEIGRRSPALAAVVFDTAVHSGTRTATKMLRRALKVSDDRDLGEAVKEAAEEGRDVEAALTMIDERRRFLDRWIDRDPERRETFRRGFENRLNALEQFVRNLVGDDDRKRLETRFPDDRHVVEGLIRVVLAYPRTDLLGSKMIQESLAALGLYSGKIDGIVGPLTKRGLTEWWKRSGK